jgi:hypothetical protein
MRCVNGMFRVPTRRTVHLPANPRPFFNHSIASKSAIVRFAVTNDRKPPIFGGLSHAISLTVGGLTPGGRSNRHMRPFSMCSRAFSADGGIDDGAFRRVTENLLRPQPAAIAFLGSAGENAYLTEEEWRHGARLGVETVAGRVPVIVGIAELTTAAAVANTTLPTIISIFASFSLRTEGCASSISTNSAGPSVTSASRPVRSWGRHCVNCCAHIQYLRATSATRAPGARLSRTIRTFSSFDHSRPERARQKSTRPTNPAPKAVSAFAFVHLRSRPNPKNQWTMRCALSRRAGPCWSASTLIAECPSSIMARASATRIAS